MSYCKYQLLVQYVTPTITYAIGAMCSTNNHFEILVTLTDLSGSIDFKAQRNSDVCVEKTVIIHVIRTIQMAKSLHYYIWPW